MTAWPGGEPAPPSITVTLHLRRADANALVTATFVVTSTEGHREAESALRTVRNTVRHARERT